jgi:hypothetical protein
MPIFSESNTIVKAVEAHLVSETESAIPVFGYCKRIIWLPTKFLKVGIDEKLKGAVIWIFLSFSLMMLGRWFVRDAGITKTEISNAIALVAMFASLLLVTFAMPSIYGHSGVSQKSVEFVVKHLQTRGFASAKDIDLLKKTTKSFEDRCRSRVNALKWLVGLLWAGFIYTFSKGFEHTMTNPSEIMSYGFVSASLLMGVTIAYLCVWGYDAALDKLFRAIEFGCNDYCHLIDAPLSNSV